MKKFMHYILGAIVCALLLFVSCERDFSPLEKTEPEEPDPGFKLSLRQAGATEMWLTLLVDSANRGEVFEVMREQFIIFKDTVVTEDTLVYDRYLQPLRNYTYYGYRLEEEKRIASVSLTAVTIDTTSHNFDWEIDTLGTWQTYLTDVWGTDHNNVYAVGGIHWPGYQFKINIIHWDGNQWEAIDYSQGTLEGIYGFGPDDIWAVGDAGGLGALITHWDGGAWRTWKLEQYERLFAIWGTSSSNLYAVGWSGTILHYNGNRWSKMESGTEKTLYDIWGVSPDDVYAVGYDPPTARGIMLSLTENGWETFIETDLQPSPLRPHGKLRSVWGFDKDNIYVTGTTTFQLHSGNWQKVYLPVDLTAIEMIRGNNMANIFLVGHFGLIIHRNGLNWRLMEQFFHQPGAGVLSGVWSSDEQVFIVGRTGDGSARGMVLRGSQ